MRWLFTGPDGPLEVEIHSSFRSNNSLIVRQAATSGFGIALLGDPLTINDIRSGRLYRLLPNYVARRRQVFIVYPSRRHLAQRTRVVIDFLIDAFHHLETRLSDGHAGRGGVPHQADFVGGEAVRFVHEVVNLEFQAPSLIREHRKRQTAQA